jgi:RNA polymerase sporulation-specific sigma factor
MDEILSQREYNILVMRYGLEDGRCRTQREIAVLLRSLGLMSQG